MQQGIAQREIERETGVSRPYIRKLARSVGFQFARNGVEVLGKICMCANCGVLFRRAKSRTEDRQNTFCSVMCRVAFHAGPNHPSWKHGESAKSFSEWVKNQTPYKEWREAVLSRDRYKCVISGRTEKLEAHHIMPKAEGFSPEKAFDLDNGITINNEVHDELHSIIANEGLDYEEAIEYLKNKYRKENDNG